MRPINRILVVVDPTTDVQHCIDKGARLARSAGADLELFICDYPADQLSSRLVPNEVLQMVQAQRRLELEAKLHALVEPLRKAHVRVVTDCSFRQPWHTGVIDKVRRSGADLVIKDTHYHSLLRRTLLTNSDWHLIRECPVPLLLTKPTPWHAPPKVAAALDPGHADDKPANLDRALLTVAGAIAALLQGEVTAVHAFDPMPAVASMSAVGTGVGVAPYVDLQLIATMRKFHDREFREVVAPFPAFAGRAELVDGAPTAALPEFVASHGVDVLVTGAVSRSPLRRLMVGSTAERLLDRLPCDILVVPATPATLEQAEVAA